MATHTAMTQGNDPALRASFEKGVGILHYVVPKKCSWIGQIRTRYTDFLVFEITKDGNVLHLKNFYKNAQEYNLAIAPEPSADQDPKSAIQSNKASDGPETASANQDAEKGSDVATIPADTVSQTSITAETAPENTGKDTTDGPDSESKTQTNPVDDISASDRSILVEIIGEPATEELTLLYRKCQENPKANIKELGTVKFPVISDKAMRSRAHSEIRRIFAGKFETTTDSDNAIKAIPAGRKAQQRGNRGGDKRSRQDAAAMERGKFLHFTLYKENRDTIDAVNHIAKALNIKPSFLGTSGTKDRRAVTVQRVSMRSRNPQSMLFINNDRINGVKIGDFSFEKEAVYLGSHKGNEFVIVMKNCSFSGTEEMNLEQRLELATSTVNSALDQIASNGFINYYGTQRFGTYLIGTHEIGREILRESFDTAIKLLLSYDPALLEESPKAEGEYVRYDDIKRAQACAKFLETGDAKEAMQLLPRRCNTELILIRHLGPRPKDYIGALLSITRGLRNMYIHAYQSFVWNHVASRRWERFGSHVVEGDIVILETSAASRQDQGSNIADDEENIHLTADGGDADDLVGKQAHALTAEEVESGRYTIFDIVLPTPGYDVVYPDNEIGKFYEEFMSKEENGGLDPKNMRRKHKDFSLSGSYRKFMGTFIQKPTASVRSYSHDHEQLVPTDLDKILAQKAQDTAGTEAGRREKQPDWYGFVDNVQDSERSQARATNENRRKAEDEAEESNPARINETWVQTSLDGSNKRVKVSKHQEKLDSDPHRDANQAQAADAMDIDEKEAGAAQAKPSGATAGQEAEGSLSGPEEKKIAVILKFALHSSQYATMVLRELQGAPLLKPSTGAGATEETEGASGV